MKQYGPYIGKDGRARIVLYDGKKTTTRSYPRILLNAPEGTEVHHRDENPSNNDISNLKILDKISHREIHTKGPSYVDIECANCLNIIPRLESRVKYNLKRGHAITCSRSCAAALAGKASGIARRVT